MENLSSFETVLTWLVAIVIIFATVRALIRL
jgi:hypothetical protein